jgi:hypothetical protein
VAAVGTAEDAGTDLAMGAGGECSILPLEKKRSYTRPTIVDTVREPLLVLDSELRVVAASRSFYLPFKVVMPLSRRYSGWPRSSALTLGPMIEVDHRRQVGAVV